MFFLDTYTEVFTILWEIAISLMIIRLALLYFSVTFLTGCVLGYVRLEYIIPKYHFSKSAAELLELPFMLVAIGFWAQLIVVRYSVPDVSWMRLGIGFIAFGCMLVVELLGRAILFADGQEQQIGKFDKIARGAFGASLLMFGFMPWLLMKAKSTKRIPASEAVENEDTDRNEEMFMSSGLRSEESKE